MMDYNKKLAQRIHLKDIYELVSYIERNNEQRESFFTLLLSENQIISYQAAWVLTHSSTSTHFWLYKKQNELINTVLTCNHSGKCRLLLTLLYKQPFENPPRVDFLNFCMDKIMDKQEPPAIIALCMKIAYELCLPIPELMNELNLILQAMDNKSSPAIESSYRNIQKAMKKNKSLRS